MKAFDFIKTLFDGWLDLEQGGTFEMHEETDEQFVRQFFGMKRVVDGKFTVGKYVYFYYPQGLKLSEDVEPDIIIVDFKDQDILLWRID